MNIDIKGVNSVLLIIIIALVLYCLIRKEMFASHDGSTPTSTACKNSNENKTFHPESTPKPNIDNCLYVGNDKKSCKVEGIPLAANSGDIILPTTAGSTTLTLHSAHPCWIGQEPELNKDECELLSECSWNEHDGFMERT